MTKLRYEEDCHPETLKGSKIAIIGYGSQGHAHALNLRDSGHSVIVGLYKGAPSWKRAEDDGFEVMEAQATAETASLVMLLVNDEKQADLYSRDIAPAMDKGKTLAFAHGFNIHFGQIVPPPDVDVIMIAPKGPGHTVRSQFLEGKGVPCLVAVHRDSTGKALEKALAYADGIGGARAGILETSFKEETETDLFGEQCVLCGGVTALMKAAFETLIEAGYQPESAYFECVHEMKLIVDLVVQKGFSFMRYSISDTAEYGDYRTGKRIITDDTKREMRKVLGEIQDGSFARDWILENKAGRPSFGRMRDLEAAHPVEAVGEKLRGMMSWAQSDGKRRG